MHISRATDYGLIGLMHLAEQADGAASVSQIAREEKLALAFLRKVFQKLGAAGLVTSRRGSGYCLAKKAKMIRVRDVVEAVDGPIAFKGCLINPSKCSLGKKCRLTKMWQRVQKNILTELKTTTIADLLR